MISFGEPALRRTVTSFLEHYHTERAHQGIGDVVIEAGVAGQGEVERQERLGGILKHCYRAA